MRLPRRAGLAGRSRVVRARRTGARPISIVVWCTAVLALAGVARPVSAQSLLPVQGLHFGVLQPGTTLRISPDDPGRAFVDVVGSGKFSLQLMVPSFMVSAQGAQMPLDILPGDAVIRWRNGSTHGLTPGGTTAINLPKGQAPGVIHIGGSARPGAAQPPGSYS